MFVKAVKKDWTGKTGRKYSIGCIYKDSYYCDSAYATGEYFSESPFELRYLEVAEIKDAQGHGILDCHSFCGDIKIIREIPLKELRKDFFFNSKCEFFEKQLETGEM